MAKYIWQIWWKGKDTPKEVVDTAGSASEANYLVGEYKLAYGGRVWATKTKVKDG